MQYTQGRNHTAAVTNQIIMKEGDRSPRPNQTLEWLDGPLWAQFGVFFLAQKHFSWAQMDSPNLHIFNIQSDKLKKNAYE